MLRNKSKTTITVSAVRWATSLLFAFLLALPAFAGDESGSVKYTPLFSMDAAYGPDTITAAYMEAYSSSNRKSAIMRWEKFLDQNILSEPISFDDVTDLTLIRQAHYELMRLYYLAGRVADGDRLLREVDQMLVYEAPRPSEVKRWCRTNHFCENTH